MMVYFILWLVSIVQGEAKIEKKVVQISKAGHFMSCFVKNMDDILFVNLTGGKYNTIIICYKIHNSK